MITNLLFTQKIQEIAHLKCISITKAAAETSWPKFKEYEEADLNQAIDTILQKDDRFDFIKLLRETNHARTLRIEAESQHNKNESRLTAYEFFHPKYSGECTHKDCPSCNHRPNCKIRATEWLKGINTILSKPRAKGEGTKMAGELINHMKHNFMREKLPF